MRHVIWRRGPKGSRTLTSVLLSSIVLEGALPVFPPGSPPSLIGIALAHADELASPVPLVHLKRPVLTRKVRINTILADGIPLSSIKVPIV